MSSSHHSINLEVLVGFHNIWKKEAGVIYLCENDTLSSLFLKLNAVYKREILKISYIDGEQDEVLCDSELEFREFLNVVKDQGDKKKYTILLVKAGYLLPQFSKRRFKKIKMKPAAFDRMLQSEKPKKRDSAVQVEVGHMKNKNSNQMPMDLRVQQPPPWFTDYMEKFKENLIADIVGAVQTQLRSSQEDQIKPRERANNTSFEASLECDVPSDAMDNSKQIESEHNYATSSFVRSEPENTLTEVNKQHAVISKAEERVVSPSVGKQLIKEKSVVNTNKSDANGDTNILEDDDFSVLSGEISVTDSESENEHALEDFMVVPMPPCFDGLKSRTGTSLEKPRSCCDLLKSKQTEIVTEEPVASKRNMMIEKCGKETKSMRGGLSTRNSVPTGTAPVRGDNNVGGMTIPNEKKIGNNTPLEVSSPNLWDNLSCHVPESTVVSEVKNTQDGHYGTGNKNSERNCPSIRKNVLPVPSDSNFQSCNEDRRPKLSTLNSEDQNMPNRTLVPIGNHGVEGVKHPKSSTWMNTTETPWGVNPQGEYFMHQQNQYSEHGIHDYFSTHYSGAFQPDVMFAAEGRNKSLDMRSYYTPTEGINYFPEEPFNKLPITKTQLYPDVTYHQQTPGQLPLHAPAITSQYQQYPHVQYHPWALQQQEVSKPSQQVPSSNLLWHVSDCGNYKLSGQEQEGALKQPIDKESQSCPYSEPVTILPEKLMQIASSAVSTACNIVGSLGKSGNNSSLFESETGHVIPSGSDGLCTSSHQSNLDQCLKQSDNWYLAESNTDQSQCSSVDFDLLCNSGPLPLVASQFDQPLHTNRVDQRERRRFSTKWNNNHVYFKSS